MAGYATRIDVTLLADGGCRVVDNGRGIPVDPYPTGPHKGKSAAEVVLTVLHAGGKFGGSGYKVSGGLHGVGVSRRQRARRAPRGRGRPRRQAPPHGVRQGRQAAGQARGRRRRRRGAAPARRSRSGPIPRSSTSTEFRAQTVLERLQMMAFLNKGLEIRFVDERPGPRAGGHLQVRGRHRRLRRHLNAVEGGAVQEGRATSTGDEDDQEVEVALQWNTGYYEGIHCFANGIATIEGGMHEEGFKKALTNVVNKYARGQAALLKEKDENLLGEDIREGLTAIISVQLREPAVRGPDQGQARQRLDALAGREGHQREAGRVARGAPDRGQPGRARRPSHAARARVAAKQARDAIRRKSALEGAGMPDKLKDCSSQRPARVRAVHRRGRLGRWLGRAGPRPAAPRRSCRSAARSSTSSGPASTRC